MERASAYFNGAFAASAIGRFRHSITTDAPAAVAVLLDALVKDETTASDRRSLALWCLTDDAAGLRERWGRELEKAAGEATAPVWAVVEAAAFVGAGTGKGEAREKLKSTGPDGLLWAVGVVLASPVMTDELRKVVRADLNQNVAAIEADDPDDLRYRCAAEWSWLGGAFSNVEPDDGTEPPAGFEVVAHFAWPELEHGQSMRLIRRSEPPGYLRLFAWALWLERWKEEAAEARERVCALASYVYHPIARVIGIGISRTNADPKQVPLIPLDDTFRDIAALKTVGGQTLFRDLPRWGHIAWLAGEGWTTIENDMMGRRNTFGAELMFMRGGWKRITTLLGLSPRVVSDVKASAYALGSHALAYRYAELNTQGITSIISIHEDRGTVAIQISPPLLPYEAKRHETRGRPSVRLVPVVGMPDLSPFGPNSQAGIGRLDFLVWLDLTETGAREEGVLIPWDRLAREARASPASLHRALDVWTATGPGQRWEQDGNLWRPFTGNPELAAAWEFLLAGSARRASAAEWGRKGIGKPRHRR